MSDLNAIIPAAGTARLTGVELVKDRSGEGRIVFATEQVLGWQKNDMGGFTPVTNLGPDWYWIWETWDTNTGTELQAIRSILKQIVGLDPEVVPVVGYARIALDMLPDGQHH